METLHREPITPEEIENKILQPRYQQIEKKTGKLFELKKVPAKSYWVKFTVVVT